MIRLKVGQALPVVQLLVEYLEAQGYVLNLTHKRFDVPVKYDNISTPIRYLTELIIYTPDGYEIFGSSACAVGDNFSRNIGTSVAFFRALHLVVRHKPDIFNDTTFL